MISGPTRRRNYDRQRESGYMLLVLMMAVAVITIVLLSAVPNYKRMILREREVEMIHRGAQYARAVRLYYRKFQRYPTSIEQLEDTNKVRFLRKRYKDPMSQDGKWQIAHLSDIQLAGLTGLAPVVPGQSVATSSSQSGSAIPGAWRGVQPEASGGSPAPADGISGGATNDVSGTASTGSSEPTSGNGSGDGPVGNSGSGPVLGGAGPMLGVFSRSKAEGIHSFNDKTHYNEWYFIFVPPDTGTLPRGPYNPRLLPSSTTVPGTGQPGPPVLPGTAPSQLPLTATPGPVGTIPPNP